MTLQELRDEIHCSAIACEEEGLGHEKLTVKQVERIRLTAKRLVEDCDTYERALNESNSNV